MPADRLTIKCPSCEKGDITILYTPRTMEMRKSSCSAKTAYSPYFKDPKTEVISDKCPNCGKTCKELEKILEKGKEPSNDEVIRRLREAGLDPTRLK